MNIFKRYKNLWMMGVVISLAILLIINFSTVMSGVKAVFYAIDGLLIGAGLAFILNLVMEPVQNFLQKHTSGWLKKHSGPIGLLTSILVTILIIVLVLAIIVPNMINAITVLTKEVPGYFAKLEQFIRTITKDYPLLDQQVAALDINWKETIEKLVNFFTNGITGAANTTINIVSGVVGGFINLFIVIVFAIYVLSDKQRFVRTYNFLTDLYLKPSQKKRLTEDLQITNQSFKAFVGGEIIEAAILSIMCMVGMFLLKLPYPTMIGVLVGVINMIPMVGAFIGGGIGAFIIFTVSPIKCLIFLVFLIVIQQIESNVFFPRVIGNRVGLPGIYVMMTIVIGGSLFGVLGMILGVPLMASVYKILKKYFLEKAQEKEEREKQIRQNASKAAPKAGKSPESEESVSAVSSKAEDPDMQSPGVRVMQNLQNHANSAEEVLEEWHEKTLSETVIQGEDPQASGKL